MKNPLGIHALVWSGHWQRIDIDYAISNSSKLGFDLIVFSVLIKLLLFIGNDRRGIHRGATHWYVPGAVRSFQSPKGFPIHGMTHKKELDGRNNKSVDKHRRFINL